MPGLIQQSIQSEQTKTAKKADPKAVERVVLAALKLIHDSKINPQILEMMKAAGDPVQALSQATLLVMRQLWEKSKQSIPPEVLGEAGVEVMSELAMIATQAKLYEITPEIFQQAAQVAMDEVQKEGQAGPAAPQGAAPQAAAPQPAQPAPQPAGV